MKRVLVTEPMHDAGLDLLRHDSGIELVQLQDVESDTLIKATPGVHAIAVRGAHLTEDILCNGKELDIVSRHGVGCDRVAVDHLSARNIPIAIASGANAQSVAEHTLMLMLATARQLQQQDSLVRTADWQTCDSFRANDLHSATALILGSGRIGRAA